MVVKDNQKELELLARLMRAEALGEGNLGMLMVGNVGITRVIGNCLDFKNITSIYQMVYQDPGGFLYADAEKEKSHSPDGALRRFSGPGSL